MRADSSKVIAIVQVDHMENIRDGLRELCKSKSKKKHT